MLNSIDFVNWIATFLSIVAAIFSFIQAKRCRKYGKKVAALENLEKFETVSGIVKKICKKLKKFDIGITPESLKGLDINKELISPIREYTRTLSKYGSIFEGNLIKTHCSQIEELIDSPNNFIETGKRINFILTQFLIVIEEQKEKNKEKIINT